MDYRAQHGASSSLFSFLLSLDAAWLVVLAWFSLELVFFFVICRLIHPRIERLRSAPSHPSTLPPRECLARLMDALHRLQGSYRPETFWSGWFKGAAHGEIRRENVKHFLCWAIWHVDSERDLPEAEDAVALEATVRQMEKLQGKPFPRGHNPDIEHVAFTREPLHFSHRLLMFYVSVKVAQMLGHGFLRLMGHRRYLTPIHSLVYWHRPCQQQEGTVKQPPLIFFHGISPGIWFYIPFLSRLGKGREIILLEVPHIVTQLSFEAPDRTETVESLAEILSLHSIAHCAVAGHSFGSIVAGWAAAAFPSQVRQLVLIDPVCLLLCLPDVAVNFLYRSPPANLFHRTLKDLIDPSSEITVAHALRRHFWWYQNVCWLQDVTCPLVVALSSEDDIVPSAAIRAYVQRHYGMRELGGEEEGEEDGGEEAGDQRNHKGNGRLVYWKGIGHGQMLVSLRAQDRLIEAMHCQAKESGLARLAAKDLGLKQRRRRQGVNAA